ncbi:MAG: APC family permease [Agromyces sp.]
MNQTADAPLSHTARLGLGSGTALYIASVLGTGILVLPGLAAAAAGPASILAVGIMLVLSIPMAGTFAALAARFPDPGGVASYVRTALGDTAARATGYWFYFGVAMGIPVLMMLGGSYISAVFGVDASVVPWIGLALFVPAFVVNWFGVEVAGWVQFVLTGLLLLVVIGVGSVAVPAVHPANLSPFFTHGWSGVGVAMSLFVWAFAGWEVGTHIAAEFRNPRRVIPLATGIALVVVGVSYVVLQVATVGVLGVNHEWGTVPLLDLVSATAPGYARVLVGLVALIVSVGVLNAYMPAFGKLGAALAERGDLPRRLSPGAKPGEVPRPALAVTGVFGLGAFALMVAMGSDLAPFILFHTANMVAIYAAGMLAATRLLPRWTLGWWMAVVATVLSVGLLALAGYRLLFPAGFVAIALIVAWRKRSRIEP